MNLTIAISRSKNKLIILLLLFSTWQVKAQKSDYIHLLDSNKVWTEAMLMEFGDFLIIDMWTGDTLSNNDTLYYELFSEDFGTTAQYLREDTIEKKVYYRRDFGHDEKLYYDFSMEVGDSISFYDTPDLYFKLEVKQTENVLGLERYVYYLKGTWDINNLEVIWIEGIGSLAGIVNPHSVPIFIWAGSTELNCYYYYDELEYQSNWASVYGCNFESLDTDELVNNTVRIYPNPADAYLYIDLSSFIVGNIMIVQIYDIYGKCVKQKKIHSIKEQINISALMSGLYFINILEDNHIIYTHKLIKS